ncbi:alanine and arginine-rich domain-containing protein [Sagmatias obliquidens]|uniref:alanine and arginine-rich domain-containing protein n=1 Tax=Sagmatias obliquidens TaxID=3371155 RepID=UPI000F443E44|nr:alanine and arginine-rich domain-containing protein [Lagenorhynchus obliquidens]
MSLGDSSRRREGTSRGPHGILVGAGLRPSTLPPSRGFPGGGESVAGPEEAPAASPLLEDLRRRLASAFQRATPRGVSRRSREEAAAEAAREERSRARVESALAGLRAELVSPLAAGSRGRLSFVLSRGPRPRAAHAPHRGLGRPSAAFPRERVRPCRVGELGTGRRSSPTVPMLLPPRQHPGGKRGRGGVRQGPRCWLAVEG